MVQSKTINIFHFNARSLIVLNKIMLNEIIRIASPTIDILLFGNTALKDEANSNILRSVQKFILRSKSFKTKQSDNAQD